MSASETQRFLNEFAVRVLIGDWPGYSRMTEDRYALITAARTSLRLTEAERRRGLSAAATRVQAAGWDGYEYRLLDQVACGQNGSFATALSRPLMGQSQAGPVMREGMLMRRIGEDLRLCAILDPRSERLWSAPPENIPPPQAEIETLIGAMQAALARRALPAFLSCFDLPFVLVHDTGIVHARSLAELRRLYDAYQQQSHAIASYETQIISMTPFGDTLLAVRGQVQARLHDGSPLDPYTNLYFLRRGHGDWRIALVFNAAIGRIIPPLGPLRED